MNTLIQDGVYGGVEKEMETHTNVLAGRIPGTEEPGGLPSMGSHRVGHDWSDLAAVAAADGGGGDGGVSFFCSSFKTKINHSIFTL